MSDRRVERVQSACNVYRFEGAGAFSGTVNVVNVRSPCILQIALCVSSALIVNIPLGVSSVWDVYILSDCGSP